MAKRQRDYKAEYARRNQRLKDKGFTSYGQAEAFRRKTVARSKGFPTWKEYKRVERANRRHALGDLADHVIGILRAEAADNRTNAIRERDELVELMVQELHARNADDLLDWDPLDDRSEFWQTFRMIYNQNQLAAA